MEKFDGKITVWKYRLKDQQKIEKNYTISTHLMNSIELEIQREREREEKGERKIIYPPSASSPFWKRPS